MPSEKTCHFQIKMEETSRERIGQSVWSLWEEPWWQNKSKIYVPAATTTKESG